jgi:hypothetical protein
MFFDFLFAMTLPVKEKASAKYRCPFELAVPHPSVRDIAG